MRARTALVLALAGAVGAGLGLLYQAMADLAEALHLIDAQQECDL